MAWQGYFFRATRTGTIFPNSYIEYEGYDSTPNQREDIKAYRDENTRDLYRITAAGHKTKIQVRIRPGLNILQKVSIQNFFRAGATDAEWKERKVQLTYWNEEDNTYYTSYFYIPDIQFKIHHLDHNNNPIYSGFEFHLIEY